MFKRTGKGNWSKMQRPSHDDHRNQTISKRLASVRESRCAARILESRAGDDYAIGRACFRSGEIRILDLSGTVERIIPFDEADRRL